MVNRFINQPRWLIKMVNQSIDQKKVHRLALYIVVEVTVWLNQSYSLPIIDNLKGESQGGPRKWISYRGSENFFQPSARTLPPFTWYLRSCDYQIRKLWAIVATAPHRAARLPFIHALHTQFTLVNCSPRSRHLIWYCISTTYQSTSNNITNDGTHPNRFTASPRTLHCYRWIHLFIVGYRISTSRTFKGYFQPSTLSAWAAETWWFVYFFRNNRLGQGRGLSGDRWRWH